MSSLIRRSGPVLLAVALLLGGCSHPSSLYAQLPAHDAPAPDITVLQADAVVVDGQHLRLIDIAAPQPAPRAHCVAEAVAARQARLRLEALAQGVRAVTISPTGGRDDHGRIEAHVLFDGHDPAEALVEEGLAVKGGPAPTNWCEPFSDAPADARRIAMLSMTGH